ncbi:MAG: hypothetical protein IRY91_02665, partial [Gemmatimonadaceae bacterium]|nr:hypothetical protein [Gemmatimonadaceae bacterium]
SLAFFVHDVLRVKRNAVTVLTIMALGGMATNVANAIGFLAADTPARSQFFSYAVDRYLLLASLLALAGTVLPLVGGWIALRSRLVASLTSVAPRVIGRLPDREVVVGGAIVGILGVLFNLLPRMPGLGTLGAVIRLLPSLMAFLLARVGGSQGRRNALVAGLAIGLLDAVRALLFAYLRSDMLLPIAAFVFGALLGSRSLRPLRSRLFVPVYIAIAIFMIYFGAFGAVRSRTGTGLSRITATLEAADADYVPGRPRQTILSRLTNFNQLSQVGRLVDEGGYMHGSTLSYLAYAFVPRVLWPDKPVIAKGTWFALQIGQAWIGRDGRINNSVNMTVPGELYLNFGWLGVIPGCLLFGGLLAVLWTKADFWRSDRNMMGSLFGFYLMWAAFSLGADLQIVVTLIAMYVIFVTVGIAWRLTIGRPRARESSPPIVAATAPIPSAHE